MKHVSFFTISSFLQRAREKKVELGLRTHHLNDGLFAKIAKGCGLDLRSWKPLALKPVYDSKGEESVTCFMGNVVKQDENMSDKVSGLNCFEIMGVPFGQDGGQEQTVKVAMKVSFDFLEFTFATLPTVLVISR